MAAFKSLVLLLSVLAVSLAQNARVKKQVHLPGVYPYVGVHPVEDDGSYWPGKYADDPVPAPVAPVAPVVPYPYAAPLAPYPYAAPVAPAHHGEDDGSYFPGKYGPE